MSRLRFIQDDSSHWYAIPSDQEKQFEKWIASYQDDNEDAEPYTGPDFDQYRLGMHVSNYTFTDLKETEEG